MTLYNGVSHRARNVGLAGAALAAIAMGSIGINYAKGAHSSPQTVRTESRYITPEQCEQMGGDNFKLTYGDSPWNHKTFNSRGTSDVVLYRGGVRQDKPVVWQAGDEGCIAPLKQLKK